MTNGKSKTSELFYSDTVPLFLQYEISNGRTILKLLWTNINSIQVVSDSREKGQRDNLSKPKRIKGKGVMQLKITTMQMT